MRVYLTGFMGCGKSVLGKELARELGLAFVDLDVLIERAEGRSVADIFADAGEEAFRRMEREQLHGTSRLENHVIALGGGALLDGRVMRWARARGVVVFIDVAEGELVRRLLESGDGRPLVAEALAAEDPRAALRARVGELMAARRPRYERADVSYRPRGSSVRQDARQLARLLRSRTAPPGDPGSRD